MQELDEVKTRNTDKKRLEALEQANTELCARVDRLTKAIVESAHVMGWPRGLLESQGIKAFDKTKDRLSVR